MTKKNPNRRLNGREIFDLHQTEILDDYKIKKMTQAQLAHKYSIPQPTLSWILRTRFGTRDISEVFAHHCTVKMVKARGENRWYKLNHIFRREYECFKNMVARSKLKKLDCYYRLEVKSFIEFLRDIGKVPNGMDRPSVGRFDHEKGYIKGNFRWQELVENNTDGSHRRHYGPIILGRKGMHPSLKMNRDLPYKSNLELAAFKKLDDNPDVRSYEVEVFRIPYDFEGKRRIYTPDIFINFVSDPSLIVEVKPECERTLPINIAKYLAAIEFCESNGYEFTVWTEDYLLE